MKLRLLALVAAVLALASLGVAGVAGAVTNISVHPYIPGNASASATAVGATNPGDPSSELCLVKVHDYSASVGVQAQFAGKVNGVVTNPASQIDIDITKDDFVTALPTCVATPITVTTNEPTNSAIQCTKIGCHGGTLQLSSFSSVQPGIKATALTRIQVVLGAGQVLKLPSGAVQVGADSLTGPSTVTMDLKPVLTVTKALLDLGACSDGQYLIDTGQNDQSASHGPRAFEIGQPLNIAQALAGAVLPTQGDADTYVATLRTCAEDSNTVPGKPVTTKIAITGAGSASVKFVKAGTQNPQLWDITRGKGCGAVKTGVTYPDALDSSRILQCKGDFGDPIPFTLDVRGIAGDPRTDDKYGIEDGNGGLPDHSLAPVTVLSGTFT
jgi:hypothetical protein